MIHITDNHDALLDYLYEEGDPAERLKIAKHLQECAACSVAVLEFQNVRGMLRDWTPPASLLGFRMVQDAGASSSARAASPARVSIAERGETSPSATLTSPSATVDQGARGGWWRGWGPATTKEKSRGWGPATPEESSRRWTGPRARPSSRRRPPFCCSRRVWRFRSSTWITRMAS